MWRTILCLVVVAGLAGCARPPDGDGSPANATSTCGHMAAQDCSACPWRDGCPIPPMDADADVQLIVEHDGPGVAVKARNRGTVPFVYSTHYEACGMTYHTDAGRQFLIPPGTHCDIANTATIEPGATVDLFDWDLTECTRDAWGCAEKRPLPAGTYHLRDTFCAAQVPRTDMPTEDCSRGASRSGASVTVA